MFKLLTEKHRTVNHMIIFHDSISMSLRIKYILVQEREAMFRLIKKVIFDFYTILKLDFITQIIYCIIHRCLFSFHTFFVLLCESFFFY